MTQAEKAGAFKALHVKGDPVELYNIWDAGSAKVVAEAGAKALATGSWSVAVAQGYGDGEEMPLAFLEQIVARIVATVDLPLTVDMEGGFAVEPEAVAANMRRIVEAGAIGMNFEDQVVKGEGLHPIELQAKRIAAIRAVADEMGVPVFINARTDLFLKADRAAHEGLVNAALERGAAYAEAGANGFFVPGLVENGLIERVCTASSLPVNVMAVPGMSSTRERASLGVGRISHGPFPYRASLKSLAERFKAETGT
jgi:2-methylisocitrate lyase-like PEP mutase family enzyme